MSNVTPERADAGTPTPVATPYEIPDQIDTATLLELTGGQPTEETPAPAPAPATLDEVPAVAEPAPATFTQEQVEQLMRTVVSNTLSTQAAGTTPAVEAEPDAMEVLRADNPSMDPEGLNWLVTSMQKVVGPIVQKAIQEEVQPLRADVDSVKGFAMQTSNERTVREYDAHLNDTLDTLKVTDPWHRQAIKGMVTAEGMKMGNAFSMNKAAEMVRTFNNQRVQSGHQSQQVYIDDKQGNIEAEPAVQHTAGAGTAAESIMARVMDAGDRDMDIGAPGFNRLVRNIVEGGKQAVSATLG